MAESRDNGIWWLPEAEDRQIAGTLVLNDREAPRLELIGAFRGLGSFGKEFSPPIILGIANGRNVTLFRCIGVGGKLTMPGFASENYVAHFALLGAHFAAADDIQFAKMAVEYDCLFEWAGLSGLTMQMNSDAEQRFSGLDVHFSFPDAPTFNIDGADISLELRGHTEGGVHGPSFAINQRVSLVVSPQAPLKLEAFLDRYLHDLSNFVTLGVGAPVRTTHIAGTLPATGSGVRDGELTVEVVFRGRDYHVNESKRHWDMLFTLSDLGSDAQRALQHWFGRATTLRAIYDLYFGTLFQERAYLHQRFLMLAQALESYHRCTVGGNHLPPEQFAALLSSLSSVVNEARPQIGREAAEAFSNKLRYFNEVSLRRRLRDLYNRQRDLAQDVIRDGPRFVSRVVNTRNYHTHYDATSQSLAVAGHDLHLLAEQMRFLLELCLLTELGLTPETIEALVSRHQRYAGLISRLQAFDPAP